MDRTQLFDTLSNLPPAAFEQLLFAMNMPKMNRAGASAKIGDQVSALLEWVESPIGPGVEAIARHLTELNHFEFDAYLRSLVATYEKSWEYYTLTDAVGRGEQPAPEKPSVFDFGLMVQTVAKETDVPGSDPRAEEREETERLPVLEGIRKYADDHVLLVGRPGLGKSTALIRLLLEEATQTLQQSEGQVPVLVELRYWNVSIEVLIQGFLQRHGLVLDDATLSTLLGQGRFLLLVDGLNELPSESARTHLSAFRRNYPKVPMIFTTRDLGLGGDLGIEKKLEMQPLTEAQMKAFIRVYVPDQAEAMLRQLNNRLREFGQTPLLLWMLCEVFQQSPNRQLPTNLAEVFRTFTTMYEDSSVRKHEVALLKGDVRALSDRRLWKEALKSLAALMIQGETPTDFRVAIHRTEAERKLGKIFANEKFPVRDILDDLLKYHLLQNRTTDQLEFRHQLIQEYYSAEYLLTLLPELSDEQLKRDYLNLLKWTEPIALMLALVDEEDQALRVVKLALDDVDQLLGSQFAGKVKLAFQPKAISLITQRATSEVLKINLLAATSSRFSIDGLLNALRNEDSYIRRWATYSLEKITWLFGSITDDQAVKALIDTLLSDQDAEVRWRSAVALGNIKNEHVVEALLDALYDPDKEVYRKAVESLGKIGNEKAVSEIFETQYNKDYQIQLEAMKALARISTKKSLKALIKYNFNTDSFNLLRAGFFIDIWTTEQALCNFLDLLNVSDGVIRTGAAYALGGIGSKNAIPALLERLEDLERDVCKAAAHSLGIIGDEKAIPFLVERLKDSDVEVRKAAICSLGQIGDKRAVSFLLNMLEDSDREVCEDAIHSIIRICQLAAGLPREKQAMPILEQAVPYLVKRLEGLDNKLCKPAVFVLLALTGNKQTIPVVAKGLEDLDGEVREIAATVLAATRDEEAIHILMKKAIDSSYVNVNFSFFKALTDGLLYPLCDGSGKPLNGKNISDLLTLFERAYFNFGCTLVEAFRDGVSQQDIKSLQETLAWKSIDVDMVKILEEQGDRESSFVLIDIALGEHPVAHWVAEGIAIKVAVQVSLEDENLKQFSDYFQREVKELGKAVSWALKKINRRNFPEEILERLDFFADNSNSRMPESINKEEVIEHLLVRVEEISLRFRLRAIESLGEVYKKQAKLVLGRMSGNLGEDLNSRIVHCLLNALQDPIIDIRIEALRILGEMGDTLSLLALILTFSKSSFENVSFLGDIIFDPFYSSDSDEVPLVDRLHSGTLLFVNSLAKQDTGMEIDLVSLEMLGLVGNSEIMTSYHEIVIWSLVNALQHPFIEVQRHAAKILAKLSENSKEAVTSLLAAINHPDGEVRETTAQVLKRIGLPIFLSQLGQAFNSGVGEVDSVISAIQNRCQFYNYEIFQGIIAKGQTISLYLSYTPADELLQAQLSNHLTLLERQGVITRWSSHQILPGEDRTQTIHQQLNTADIILLLISPDTIADDTCYHLEIQRAMHRHQSGEARVIPILLRPVDWQGAPFSQLPVFPKNHQPVTTWPNQDEAFQEIAAGIREIALELRRNAPATG